MYVLIVFLKENAEEVVMALLNEKKEGKIALEIIRVFYLRYGGKDFTERIIKEHVKGFLEDELEEFKRKRIEELVCEIMGRKIPKKPSRWKRFLKFLEKAGAAYCKYYTGEY